MNLPSAWSRRHRIKAAGPQLDLRTRRIINKTKPVQESNFLLHYTCSSHSHVLVSCTRNFTCSQNMHLHVSATIIEMISFGPKAFACYKQSLLGQRAVNMSILLHKYCLFYLQVKNLQCTFSELSYLTP